MRITYSAANHVLTTYYDADGIGSGYHWAVGAAYNVAGVASAGVAGMRDWQMTAGDTFQIVIFGYSGRRRGAGRPRFSPTISGPRACPPAERLSTGSLDLSYDPVPLPSIDPTYDPNPGAHFTQVFATALLPGGGQISGSDTDLGPAPTDPTNSVLVQFDAMGRADPALSVKLDGEINAVAVQADGKLLVAGAFGQVNGVSQPPKLVRLHPNGAVDGTFNVGGTGGDDGSPTASPYSPMANWCWMGYSPPLTAALATARIARLNASGSVDATFNSGGAGHG